MAKKVVFQDVGFIQKKQVIFEHFSFEFKEGKPVCLIGQNGVGKTLLLKMVAEKSLYEGLILKEGSCEVIFSLENFANVTIAAFLRFSLLSAFDQRQVLQFLKLQNLGYSMAKLNKKFQLKVLLLSHILKRPKFLFLDAILDCFSMNEKEEFFSLLIMYGITLFYVTCNMEDTLFFPYLVVMGKDGILMEGSTLALLQEEKILKRLGFSLPFFIDLSRQLQNYDLIQGIYTDYKELTSTLWK